MKAALTWALLVLWAVLIVASLWVYSQRQLSDFDPLFTLSTAAASQNFDSRFTTLLAQSGIGPGSVVHINSASACVCDSLTASHQAELNSRLSAHGYKLETLKLEKHALIASFLSSVPALAVVDPTGNLRYVGPYSEGYGCLTGRTFVDKITALASSGFSAGAVVQSDAKGCYCKV